VYQISPHFEDLYNPELDSEGISTWWGENGEELEAAYMPAQHRIAL
jgi:hypothetical protein